MNQRSFGSIRHGIVGLAAPTDLALSNRSITSSLDRIKGDLAAYLPDDSITNARRQVHHGWRERSWGPVNTVQWTVETHFAELKTTLKMRKVKSKTAVGVQKEIAIYCLVYNLVHNLVHLVMLAAARRQEVEPDRISFIDTVRWLLAAAPGETMPILVVNPRRKGRHEPRVIKDLQDTYPKMKLARAKMKRHPNMWPGRAKKTEEG
jgi:hypothetical protein